MIRWIDAIRFTKNGNLTPPRKIVKSNAEWRKQLSEETYFVTREKGTERAHSSDLCSLFEPGIYACTCCETQLFDANQKFESGTGWPSFTQPLEENTVGYVADHSHGMSRIEVTCNVCDAHLGHVFPDGPEPSGMRYCINALSLKKVKSTLEKAVFGGGCFWCTEAVLQRLQGVEKIVSGYSDGNIHNPTYREICSGLTGHAEVVEVTFNPKVIDYKTLLLVFMTTHDPTTLNRQGADVGTQYRSTVLFNSEAQKEIATELLHELKNSFDTPIVTEIKPLSVFYKAEVEHQNYYNNNSEAGYCSYVISPKIQKLKKLYTHLLK